MKKNNIEAKDIISIGGVPYFRKAKLNGWGIHIVGYDINTERHLIIRFLSDKEERIELDNDRLELTECERIPEGFKC